jgi:hypothetical protein
MEGAYNKVLAAKQELPGEYLQYYMEQLASTVRSGGMTRQGGWGCRIGWHGYLMRQGKGVVLQMCSGQWGHLQQESGTRWMLSRQGGRVEL